MIELTRKARARVEPDRPGQIAGGSDSDPASAAAAAGSPSRLAAGRVLPGGWGFPDESPSRRRVSSSESKGPGPGDGDSLSRRRGTAPPGARVHRLGGAARRSRR